MAVCTFFGHREIYESIIPQLTAVLRQLIEQDGVDEFYVGNHGQFDRTVTVVLLKLRKEYPHIRFFVVWSRTPKADAGEVKDRIPAIFPVEVANALPRFAVLARNRWMLDRADVVVTYVTHSMGGAGRFKEMAERKHKQVVNLPDMML